MSDLPAKKKGMRPPGTPTYPQHIIDHALLTMAYTRQAKAAHTQLKLEGLNPCPGESTLRAWRNQYAGRLAELTEKHGAEIDRHIVSGFLDVVAESQELERLLIVKTREAAERNEISPKDLAGAMRNASTTKAINVDKVLLYQGRPTQIVGKEKDAEESLRSLANRFAVDSEAKEEGPKELES